MNKFLAGVGTALLLVLLVTGGYFLGKGQGDKEKASDTIAAPKSVSSSPATSASPDATSVVFVNPSATIAAIKDVILKKKYPDLAPFMAEKVNVIIYASSCCGDLKKSEAIEQLKYLDQAKAPWDFDQTSAIAQKLATDVPQYFKDKTIGISANKYSVAFGLNSKFLIDKIVLVVDYTIVAPF
jgi:hypothetical protein